MTLEYRLMTQFDTQFSPTVESSTPASIFNISTGSLDTVRTRRKEPAHLELDLVGKRILDIFFSFLFMVLAVPFFLLIAVAIKFTSKGPIFFRQERVGLKGQRFQIWKFRTMTVEDSKKEHQQFVKELLHQTDEGDNTGLVDQYMQYIEKRITPVGRFLRATSLDELPQLFNIFGGRMSLVGPRPHPVYEVDEYKSWYRRRLDVKPGLTGWSKLNLRLTPKNYEESILYDLWYVDHRNLLLDLRILLLTVPFVLSMKDAH